MPGKRGDAYVGPYAATGQAYAYVAKEQGFATKAALGRKMRAEGDGYGLSDSIICKVLNGQQLPSETFRRAYQRAVGLPGPQLQKLLDERSATNRPPASEEQNSVQVAQGSDLSKELMVVCDRNAVEPQLGGSSPWFGRLKWIGFHGGANWVDVLLHEYPRVEQLAIVPDLVEKALSKQVFGTFVSLGPGDGELDGKILDQFSHAPIYIPVDIGMALLARTWQAMRDRPRMRMPFGIIGDFEEHFAYIAYKAQSVSADQPILYCLAGNTFGNLEEGEKTFLNNVRPFLRAQDMLLIHVSCVDQTYDYREDPLYCQFEDKLRFKRFVAYPIERTRLDVTVEEVVANWNSYVEDCEWRSNLGENAVAFAWIDKTSQKPLQIITRYKLTQLAAWMQETRQGFELIGPPLKGDRQTRLQGSVAVHDGVLLLRTQGPDERSPARISI